MKTFEEFHDGFVDGFLIQNSTLNIYLSTFDQRKFALMEYGILSLKVDGFRQGNIIFDVSLRYGKEITLHDIVTFYEFKDEDKARVKLAEAVQKNLALLEINPSYGATCTVLAESIVLSPRWC